MENRYVPTKEDFRFLDRKDLQIDANFASQSYWKGVFTHFFKINASVHIVQKKLVGKLGIESLFKTEIRIPFLEMTEKLKGMDQGMVLDTRLEHDLIAIAFLTLIPSARRSE